VSESKLREDIARWGKAIFDRGLTAGTSGNLSVRLDDGWLLTPTNSCLGFLDPARLSKLDERGNLLAGDPPSKELVLHRAVYDSRAGARAVVHLHSTHSVAVSMLPGVDPHDVLPPLTAYYVMKIGRLPLVPYLRPGDPRLGPAVAPLMRDHTAVLLANHGPVVAGDSLDAAIAATEELEATARLHLLLHDRHPRVLTPEQLAELRDVFGTP
jgi:ribulose-5-phosphate 4-epimerase/fuculose-1-phosphate aldolase